MTTEKETAWETETGLPNDVDVWIANPRFGEKEEYSSKVAEASSMAAAPIMFLMDLVDKKNELVGTQGYSIGTGWEVSEDGLEITHPKRKNVVGSSMYGMLQRRVVKELGVDMDQYGLPTKAMSWDKLGFHMMLEEHAVVGGGTGSSLMPVTFLGKREDGGGPTPSPAGTTKLREATVLSELELKLVDLMAEHTEVKTFQLAAIKMPGVSANDELMASVLDEGPDGFWAKNRK